MTRPEAELYALLQRHAFNSPTCCPSQALLATQLNISREYCNKTMRRLRERGVVSWTRARAPGAKWEHNVYTLHGDWHRPYRRPLVSWLRVRRGGRPLPPVVKRRRRQFTLKDQRKGNEATIVNSYVLRTPEERVRRAFGGEPPPQAPQRPPSVNSSGRCHGCGGPSPRMELCALCFVDSLNLDESLRNAGSPRHPKVTRAPVPVPPTGLSERGS